MDPVTTAAGARHLVAAMPRYLGKAAKGVAGGYWRLPLIGQLFAAFMIMAVADIGAARLGVHGHDRRQMLLILGVVLVGTMIVATLTHGTGGQRKEG